MPCALLHKYCLDQELPRCGLTACVHYDAHIFTRRECMRRESDRERDGAGALVAGALRWCCRAVVAVVAVRLSLKAVVALVLDYECGSADEPGSHHSTCQARVTREGSWYQLSLSLEVDHRMS